MGAGKMDIWILFYFVLLALGSVLGYLSWSQYQKSQTLLTKGMRTKANVVAYETSRGKNSTLYAPVFEYKDRSQEVITFTSSVKSSPPAYDLGQQVNIVYNTSNPQDVKIVSFWGLYAASVILLMIASPLLILGGSYLLYASG